MRRDLNRVLDGLYGALNWWLEGLWIGLPARARSSLFTERIELVVRFGDGTAIVSAGETPPVTVDTNDANARAALAHLIPDASSPDVTVYLPRGVVLTHTLRLPTAVENDLRNVLTHELDRLTPFEINDVVFDYRVRERGDAYLLVDIALTRRTVLDELIAKLQRLDLRATAATTEDANSARLALNLLPRPRRLRLPGTRLAFRRALAVAAALLLLAALYLPLSRYERVLEARAEIVERARADAVAARTRLTEQEAALAGGDLLTERRSDYVPPIALLRELTAQIPEHTWLSRLAISRGDVYLQGESAAATELLQLLESTELLRDAQFQAPLSRADESGKEQFTIAAKLARSAP